MEVPAQYSKCKRQLCNLWQSKDERAAKYALARQCSFNSYEARRMRDWRVEYILRAEKYFKEAQQVFRDRAG